VGSNPTSDKYFFKPTEISNDLANNAKNHLNNQIYICV